MKTFVTGLILFFFIAGCKEPPPPAFTSRQRELMDTLYLARVSGLRERLDSVCDTNYNQLLQQAVDSLIRVRKEEEAKLRARIIQPQQ